MKYLFLTLLLLTACTGAVTYSIPVEVGPPIEVLFCPADTCADRFIALAEHAEQIQCAFFDLDIPEIIKVLEGKNAEVVIDANNKQEQLNPLNPIYDNNNQYMHNKFCILDDIVWTGSMNPTENGDTKNNNNVLIIPSPSLAENYRAEFAELQKKQFGKGAPTPHPLIVYNNNTVKNYFCPEDSCKKEILAEISNAKQEIIVMAFSFTDQDIANKLIEKAEEGVVVKVLFEKRRINMQYNVYKLFENTNVQTFTDTNPAVMHHKVFVIDRNTVITGSMNPTKSGNERNDENILILHDPAVAIMFGEEFGRLI